MPQKLIIDADPGIGDALAVVTALVDPSVEVAGLTAVAGAVSGQQATRNLQFLTDLLDPVKHPRIGQSEGAACSGDAYSFRHAHASGEQGLGDLTFDVIDLANRRESEKLIVDLAQEFPNEVKVLTLGPLTNLASALEPDPDLPRRLDGVVCLGGTDGCPGDVSAVSEFNIGSDPESADMEFASDLPLTLVPLNISSRCVLTFEDVNALTDLIEGSFNGRILADLLQYALKAHRDQAREGLVLPELAALAVALRAETFSIEAVRCAVETSGTLTRGMTVIDRRTGFTGQSNLDIVSSIDHHGVVDYFSRSLKRASGSGQSRDSPPS